MQDDLSQSDCAAHHPDRPTHTVQLYRCASRPRFKVIVMAHYRTQSKQVEIVPFFDRYSAAEYAERKAGEYGLERYDDFTGFVSVV